MPLPITLIVDDPAPLINVYWWHVAEPTGTDRPTLANGEPVVRDIPVDFFEGFVEVTERWGVGGKFSVLPWPAALGSIETGWPGCDAAGLERWLELARRHVAPRFDITPEILTHARALDLETMTPLDVNERDWAATQTAATMTPYIARALEILEGVGLRANGVTSPWDFGTEVEDEYRIAIRRALLQVHGLRQSWYFLHADDKGTAPRSQVTWRDGDAWQVSLWSQVDDYLWRTMDAGRDDAAYVRQVADHYLTEDGADGRLAALLAAGTPMVLCTHWQSLYSNGRRTGLRIFDEVCRRVAARLGDRVAWRRCSEVAAQVAAGG